VAQQAVPALLTARRLAADVAHYGQVRPHRGERVQVARAVGAEHEPRRLNRGRGAGRLRHHEASCDKAWEESKAGLCPDPPGRAALDRPY